MSQVPQTNPFVQSRAAQSSNAVAQSASDQQIAEVQGRMVIAKRFPRDQVRAMDSILIACQRPTLAEGALYSYARGGTEITGASIRLAEAMAQAWGNIDFGIRELSQANGESVVEAYAWDMETNTRQSKTFQVPHKRYTKNGTKDLVDPRDIYELVANNGARRLRACILGVIPGDVQETAVRQCEETLKSTADTSPENIKKMLGAFAAFGVTQKMIETSIQRRIDSMTPGQMVGLKKKYQSIKDGMASPADFFDIGADGDIDQPRQREQTTLPPCSDEEFSRILHEWKPAIDARKQTAAQMIAKVGTKVTLSEAQKQAIYDCEKPDDPQEPASQSDDGFFTDYENAANNGEAQ